MVDSLILGVLALQGGVIEHVHALEAACKNLHIMATIREVRYKEDLENLDGLVIPGGESTVLHKLAAAEGMFEGMKRIPAYFGTCAGMILLAKKIEHGLPDQKTLELMDIAVDRNAYGSQADSFEADLKISFSKTPVHAIFIRAPKILSTGPTIQTVAWLGNHPVAFEEQATDRYFLACAFHPELTTSVFHEYFLQNLVVLKEAKNTK